MSDWISHVKKYAAVNQIPYKQALREAASSYKKGGCCKKSKYESSESESSYEELVESEEDTESEEYESDISSEDYSSEYYSD